MMCALFKNSYFFLIGCFFALVFSGCGNSQKKASDVAEISPKNRIVTLNGALSETVYSLGKGDELVGRDVTGTFPEYVRDSVKDLGHVRSISVEAILSLQPNMVLAINGDLNESQEAALKNTGIDFHLFDRDFSVEGAKKLVTEVGEKIGEKNIASILSKIDEDVIEIKSFTVKPKVLFVYARGAGTLMIAGENTPMQAMIELAGGENAVSGIKNFKPLTEEALLNANPDVVLLFDSGLQSLGGKEGFLKTVPALSQTNAGKNKAFLAMDGGLLSEFGPRVGEAALKLNRLLMPYAE